MVNAQFADARVARWELDWLQSGASGLPVELGLGPSYNRRRADRTFPSDAMRYAPLEVIYVRGNLFLERIDSWAPT